MFTSRLRVLVTLVGLWCSGLGVWALHHVLALDTLECSKGACVLTRSQFGVFERTTEFPAKDLQSVDFRSLTLGDRSMETTLHLRGNRVERTDLQRSPELSQFISDPRGSLRVEGQRQLKMMPFVFFMLLIGACAFFLAARPDLLAKDEAEAELEAGEKAEGTADPTRASGHMGAPNERNPREVHAAVDGFGPSIVLQTKAPSTPSHLRGERPL